MDVQLSGVAWLPDNRSHPPILIAQDAPKPRASSEVTVSMLTGPVVPVLYQPDCQAFTGEQGMSA